MSLYFIESFVKGTLHTDGTLRLEEQPVNLQPGPVEVIIRQRSNNTGDWWTALAEIIADQKKRGFVGTVTDIERSDEGYTDRIREIDKDTERGSTAG